jgi:hypothetical protein
VKPNQLTMSALPRTFACPSSLVLPHTPYDNVYSDDGKDAHAEMQAAAINREWHKLPPRVAELVSQYDPEDVYPELILVYDYVQDVARSLDKRAARDYSGSGPFEIPGTADLVAVDRRHRRGLVVDYKRWEEVGAPDANTQTLGYSVALARLFSLDEVTVAISYLGDGKRHTEVATLDELDFVTFADRLKQLNVLVASAAADRDRFLAVGRQCRWCPAFHDCPKQKELTIDVDDGTADERMERLVPLHDDRDAADAYDFLARLRVLTKRLGDALWLRASERPIPLSNGKFYGRVEKRGNLELDADTVYKVVRAKHGQAIADMAVERVATQTKLEDALRFAGVKTLKSAKDDIIADVERLGGTSRKPKSSVEEVDQSKLAAPQLSTETLAAANQLVVEASTSTQGGDP